MSARARSRPDRVITDIADYVEDHTVTSELAWETIHYCLIDSLGCAFEALSYPECAKLLGPVAGGTVVPHGARVPATPFVLDPVQAAFNIGMLIRWLDYNDCFYGRTVIHPSDAFGGILAVADWASRTRTAQGGKPLFMREVMAAAIKAYEIMGGLAAANAFTTRMGLDHVLLVKIACAAVAVKLLGGARGEIENAVSNAWIDGHVLATFRRKPNAGTRKSWAAGDAASRGVWLALMALRGEMGYPSALTTKTWGFYDVMCGSTPLRLQRPYGTYVAENVQFKISYPAGIHAQTAAEAAIRMHPQVRDRLEDIRCVELWTHGYGMGILNKAGPLRNPADRDHCLQYVVAIGMIFGRLESDDYEDRTASDPRIDRLRDKMIVREDKRYSRDFLAPGKRSNANAVRVHFKDGTSTARIEIEYPAGHPRRRQEGIPLLVRKYERSLARVFTEKRRRALLEMSLDRERLAAMRVDKFFDGMAL